MNIKRMLKKKLSDLTSEQGQETPAPTSSVKLPAGFKSIEGDKVSINLEYLRGQNIFFATPCYGGVVTDQYFLSMFRLSQVLMQYGIKFRITTLRNESLIPRARNILTAMFLEDASATHLMFIDADVEFDPDSVIRMLAMDKDVIAAAYPKKYSPKGAYIPLGLEPRASHLWRLNQSVERTLAD